MGRPFTSLMWNRIEHGRYQAINTRTGVTVFRLSHKSRGWRLYKNIDGKYKTVGVFDTKTEAQDAAVYGRYDKTVGEAELREAA